MYVKIVKIGRIHFIESVSISRCAAACNVNVNSVWIIGIFWLAWDVRAVVNSNNSNNNNNWTITHNIDWRCWVRKMPNYDLFVCFVVCWQVIVKNTDGAYLETNNRWSVSLCLRRQFFHLKNEIFANILYMEECKKYQHLNDIKMNASTTTTTTTTTTTP